MGNLYYFANYLLITLAILVLCQAKSKHGDNHDSKQKQHVDQPAEHKDFETKNEIDNSNNNGLNVAVPRLQGVKKFAITGYLQTDAVFVYGLETVWSMNLLETNSYIHSGAITVFKKEIAKILIKAKLSANDLEIKSFKKGVVGSAIVAVFEAVLTVDSKFGADQDMAQLVQSHLEKALRELLEMHSFDRSFGRRSAINLLIWSAKLIPNQQIESIDKAAVAGCFVSGVRGLSDSQQVFSLTIRYPVAAVVLTLQPDSKAIVNIYLSNDGPVDQYLNPDYEAVGLVGQGNSISTILTAGTYYVSYLAITDFKNIDFCYRVEQLDQIPDCPQQGKFNIESPQTTIKCKIEVEGSQAKRRLEVNYSQGDGYVKPSDPNLSWRNYEANSASRELYTAIPEQTSVTYYVLIYSYKFSDFFGQKIDFSYNIKTVDTSAIPDSNAYLGAFPGAVSFSSCPISNDQIELQQGYRLYSKFEVATTVHFVLTGTVRYSQPGIPGILVVLSSLPSGKQFYYEPYNDNQNYKIDIWLVAGTYELFVRGLGGYDGASVTATVCYSFTPARIPPCPTNLVLPKTDSSFTCQLAVRVSTSTTPQLVVKSNAAQTMLVKNSYDNHFFGIYDYSQLYQAASENKMYRYLDANPRSPARYYIVLYWGIQSFQYDSVEFSYEIINSVPLPQQLPEFTSAHLGYAPVQLAEKKSGCFASDASGFGYTFFANILNVQAGSPGRAFALLSFNANASPDNYYSYSVNDPIYGNPVENIGATGGVGQQFAVFTVPAGDSVFSFSSSENFTSGSYCYTYAYITEPAECQHSFDIVPSMLHQYILCKIELSPGQVIGKDRVITLSTSGASLNGAYVAYDVYGTFDAMVVPDERSVDYSYSGFVDSIPADSVISAPMSASTFYLLMRFNNAVGKALHVDYKVELISNSDHKSK